jgi:hypothetical protein
MDTEREEKENVNEKQESSMQVRESGGGKMYNVGMSVSEWSFEQGMAEMAIIQ